MQLAISTTKDVNLQTGTPTGTTTVNMALLQDDGTIVVYMRDMWSRSNSEPANLVDVAVGPAGFWCLDTVGNIYKWNQDAIHSVWTKDTVAKDVTTLTCDSDGNLWCINKKGEMYVSHKEFGGLGGDNHWKMANWKKSDIPGATEFSNGHGNWEYMVKQGDHLLQIVRDQYHVADGPTVNRIADGIVQLNGLANRDQIKPNQKLNMPAR